MPPPQILAGSPRSLGMRASLIRSAMLADLIPRLNALNLPSLSCLHALSRICTHPGLTQSRLADALGLSRASTTRICSALDRAGYIARHEGTDARTHELTPTSSGADALSVAFAQCAAGEERLFGILDEDQRVTLERLLDKVLIGVSNDR